VPKAVTRAPNSTQCNSTEIWKRYYYYCHQKLHDKTGRHHDKCG